VSNFVTCPPSALPYPVSQQRIIDSIREKEQRYSDVKFKLDELIYTNHTSFIASPEREYEAKKLYEEMAAIDAAWIRDKASLGSVSLNSIASSPSGMASVSSSSYNQAYSNNPPTVLPVPAVPSNPLPKRVVDKDNPYDIVDHKPLQRRLTVQRIKSLLQEDPLTRFSSCADCKKNYGTPHYSCDHCNPPSELTDAVRLIAELAYQLDQRDAAKSSEAELFNNDQLLQKKVDALKAASAATKPLKNPQGSTMLDHMEAMTSVVKKYFDNY
jgi:hypothetical protein